jgi:hypothetical protein
VETRGKKMLSLEDSRRGMQIMRALKKGGGHFLKIVGQEMPAKEVNSRTGAAIDDAEYTQEGRDFTALVAEEACADEGHSSSRAKVAEVKPTREALESSRMGS